MREEDHRAAEATPAGGGEWSDLVLPGGASTALGRFTSVVRMRPGAVAVDSHGTALTYADLDVAARALAGRLLAELQDDPGAPDGAPVAVLADQGVQTVTAMVAGIMVRRPVVLLDPLLPTERQRQLLDQAGARLVVLGEDCGPADPDALLEGLSLPRIRITTAGALAEAADAPPAGELAAAVGEPLPEDPVTIVFTSGSTGAAKGVVLSNSTVLAAGHISREGLGIGPRDRVALVLPHAFAAGQEVVFMSLFNGAALHAYDPRTAGLRELPAWLAGHGITTLHCTPSLLRSITGALAAGPPLPGIRLVTTCGEAVYGRDVEAIRRHLGPDAAFTSWLGASEVGQLAFCTIPGGDPVPRGIVPVGPPVALKEISILDDAGSPLAAGEVGAVNVTSAYLSAGYWRDERRTAERFLPTEDGRTRYATGDRGYLDESGSLHVVGRGDDAVKIRGYLVEPAEVEAALLALDGVAQAVVRGRESAASPGTGDPMALAAWVVPAPGPVPSVSQLRRELRETLPDWMVPTSVQLVAQLPLNERGKLDVAALPDPPPRPAPRPAAGWWDREIGQIWADVLGLESVDPDEGFIQLGGDSLATEEMLSRLHDNLSLDLTVTQLAENPTLREFAALAERAATGGKGQERTSPTVVRLRDAGSRVPLVCFAGAATHGLAFTSLAGALPDHPVHAFHASGLVSRAKLDWSIRSHARRHVRDLTRLVPEGPVVLLGHSLGGLIAIEAARMLAEQGREVPLLVLLDAFLPPRHGGYVGNWSVRPPYGAAQGAFTPPEPPSVPTPRSPLALLLHTLRTQSRDEVQQRLLLPFAGALQLPTELNKKVFWQQGLWLSRTARLGPWPGRTLVLYTDENPDDMENWDALLTGEHTVLRVEGDHPGILRPPYLDAVVRLIEEQLEQVTVHPAG